MRPTTTVLGLTLALAAGGVAHAHAQSVDSFLKIDGVEARLEISGSGWGRIGSGAWGRISGKHILGPPPKGTTTLSILVKESSLPIVADGGWVDIVGDGGWQDLRVPSERGKDRVYRFSDVSGWACDRRTARCTFEFGKVEAGGG